LFLGTQRGKLLRATSIQENFIHNSSKTKITTINVDSNNQRWKLEFMFDTYFYRGFSCINQGIDMLIFGFPVRVPIEKSGYT